MTDLFVFCSILTVPDAASSCVTRTNYPVFGSIRDLVQAKSEVDAADRDPTRGLNRDQVRDEGQGYDGEGRRQLQA